MTNTYTNDAPINEKILEELRLLRSVNERLLRKLDEGLFVDYQMEKFGSTPTTGNPCDGCYWPRQLRDVYHGTYVGDTPCQWCPHGPKVTCKT